MCVLPFFSTGLMLLQLRAELATQLLFRQRTKWPENKQEFGRKRDCRREKPDVNSLFLLYVVPVQVH
jgi:hypothetical protein